MQQRVSPQQAWEALIAGNHRFIAGSQQHPHQDAARRDQLLQGQSPDVALFGCADSRLAAEIIFDRGLGDLFVIRNMGHVVAESIIASLEFAVSELGAALVVVLSHDSCGAVKAAIDLAGKDPAPMPPAVSRTLQPIIPAVQQVWITRNNTTPYVCKDQIDADDAARMHLKLTVNDLLRSSLILRDAVAEGRLGVVGCHYNLAEGNVHPITAVGKLQVTES